MAVYCQNCGAEILADANYCPQCGTCVNGSSKTGSTTTSNAVKTAAAVGGVVVGVSALNNLAHRLSHRRRPMYGGPDGGR